MEPFDRLGQTVGTFGTRFVLEGSLRARIAQENEALRPENTILWQKFTETAET